jgi:hypothetical protein
MKFVTNPAFGVWDMDSIGETFSSQSEQGTIGVKHGHGGAWCPGCKEKGIYNWLDNPKLGCRECNTHLTRFLTIEDYVKGTMTYREEQGIKKRYEIEQCRKMLAKKHTR